MRLVCPNCDAEYEVDDAAIPQAGRDVQCSNCGHAWFQVHPEVEAAQDAEAALYEAPVAARPDAAAQPVTAPAVEMPPVDATKVDAPAVSAPAADLPLAEERPVEMPVGEEDEPDVAAAEILAVPPAVPPAAQVTPLTPEQAIAAMLSGAGGSAEPVKPMAPSRSLDASVLAVLREEAERETAARRSEGGLETQVEMGLDSAEVTAASGGLAAAAMRRIARMKGDPEPQPEPIVRTRREMLPGIDEINSTLRATGARRSEEDNVVLEDDDDRRAKRSGFGRGFMLLVLLALIIVALYLAAPMIGERFPAAKAPMDSYVATVDVVRLWVDTKIKALIATLRGLEGGQAG